MQSTPTHPPALHLHPSGLLMQVHGCCHADVVQQTLQLQKTSHGNDLGGLGAFVRYFLPPAIWIK